MSIHTDLVDAVNDAKTEREREIAETMLRGFRKGLEHCNRWWSATEIDQHTMNRYGREVLMCCGVIIKE